MYLFHGIVSKQNLVSCFFGNKSLLCKKEKNNMSRRKIPSPLDINDPSVITTIGTYI